MLSNCILPLVLMMMVRRAGVLLLTWFESRTCD